MFPEQNHSESGTGQEQTSRRYFIHILLFSGNHLATGVIYEIVCGSHTCHRIALLLISLALNNCLQLKGENVFTENKTAISIVEL